MNGKSLSHCNEEFPKNRSACEVMDMSENVRSVFRMMLLVIGFADGVIVCNRTEAAQVLVDATPSLRVIDARHFGLNTGLWDSHFEEPANTAVLRALGVTALRFPGGS